MAAEIVGRRNLMLVKFTIHALGKEFPDVLVFGKGYMGALVPCEAFPKLRVDMPVWMGIFFQKNTSLMSQMVGAGKSGKSGTEDEIHDLRDLVRDFRNKAHHLAESVGEITDPETAGGTEVSPPLARKIFQADRPAAPEVRDFEFADIPGPLG